MIDLRSDTVTRPTDAMRAAMAAAPVGDDVFGDDPTVRQLEEHTAALLGLDAAVFVPSGTQSNLCALLSHCERGDEYLVGQTAHTYKYEGGGAAVLGSIQPQPVEMNADGSIDLDLLASYVKADDPHFARTRLLALENTKDGQVLDDAYVKRAQEWARATGLSLHLDGARLWNAAVASGVAPADIAAGFDTVSVCLSKGLGAPVGSVLAGSEEHIADARRWRKMLGGGMRQAGVLAAAGLHALEHHIDRLADDHRHAERLAEGLATIDSLTVAAQNTNMVFLELHSDAAAPDLFAGRLRESGITIIAGSAMRWVCHLDVTAIDVEAVIDAVAAAITP